MRIACALSVLAVLAGCGDPLFFADVQARKICVTMPSQQIPGAPDITANVLKEGDWDLGDDLRKLMSKDGASATIQVLEFTIADANGQADLTGISDASVVVARTDGTDPVTLLAYTRPQNDPPQHEIDMSGQSVDVGTYLDSGKLHYKVAAHGTLPPTTWTADLQACMHAEVKVDALKAIQSKN